MSQSTSKTFKRLLNSFILVLTVGPEFCLANEAYIVTEVSDGIFYHQGVHQDANENNKGAIANVGFIVGKSCIAVVDSGGSYDEGQALYDAIRAQSDLPICYVINTHVHPDHVLGNAVFKNTGATYVGSVKLPAAMAAREGFYETRFKEILGDAYGDAEFIAPTKLVEIDKPESIDLGGRLLTLIAYPTAHTDNDLVVLDNNTMTLWTGDLLFVDRIPALDGSINGWLRVMNVLKTLDVNTVIPGHGSVLQGDWKTALDKQNHYFTQIHDQVLKIINDMGTITQATEEVTPNTEEHWVLYEDYHKRNVTASYTELEWE